MGGYLCPYLSHCLIWCIWSERNVRRFEEWEWSLFEIKSFFFHTLLLWSMTLSHFSFFSLPVYLIIVILDLDFCLHNTFTMNSGWLFFLNKIFRYLTKKKKIKKSSKHSIELGNSQIWWRMVQQLQAPSTKLPIF